MSSRLCSVACRQRAPSLGATNVRAGGRTPVAGIIHSVAILLFTVGAGSLIGYLAMPALAGLLMVTGWIMSEPGRWRERLALRPGDRTLLFLTMILTVASNLTVAIAVGTGLGLALRLIRRDVEPADWTRRIGRPCRLSAEVSAFHPFRSPAVR